MLALDFALIDKPGRSVEEEARFIRRQLERGVLMRTVEANQDTGDVVWRYRRIESLFRQLQVSIRPLMSCAAV